MPSSTCRPTRLDEARDAIAALRPAIRIMGAGEVDRDLQGGRAAGRRRRPFRPAQMAGTHGIGHTRMATEIGGHDARRASVLDRRRPVPGAQRLAVQPQQCAPRADPRGHDLRDRERHRGRRRLSLVTRSAHGKNLGEALEGSSPISTASSPSSSAPRTASAWCAIRSPASRR